MATLIRELAIPYKDIKLHLTWQGSEESSAPNIIFLHMTGSHGGFFQPFSQQLAKEGFQVWSLDLMGHGQTTGRRGVFTMADFIGNVQATIEVIRHDNQAPIAIIGTHLGAEVAFNAAIEDSRIAAVVAHNLLLASQLSFNWQVKLAKSILASVLARWFSIWVELEKVYDHRLLFDDPEILAKFRHDPMRVTRYNASSYLTVFRWRSSRPLRELTVPVLLICGENGRLIRPEFQRRVYQKLQEQGINVRLNIVPAAGNQILVEQVAETARIVRQWLEKSLKEKKG